MYNVTRTLDRTGHPNETAAAARISSIYQELGPPLRRYLKHLAREGSPTADDLLQETMLRAWRHVDAIPQEPLSAKRWLFTVARRIAIDATRRRRSRPPETELNDGIVDIGDDPIAYALAARDIWYAMTNLTDSHRDVLERVFLRGSSPEETAVALDIPVGTVRSRVHYGLRSLRAQLDQDK